MYQIKNLRIAAGITQKELANAVGIAQASLCNMEKGKISPTLATASRLASALNCTVDDLLSDARKEGGIKNEVHT